MNSEREDRELLDRLAGLPREIRPARDPWPEISARITRKAPGGSSAAKRQGWWLRAVAASAVIAVLAGLVFSPPGIRTSAGPDVATTDIGFGTQHDAVPTQASMAISEAEYLAAFREFIPVGDSRHGLQAETLVKIEQGWADLQSTEAALVLALENNPNDKFLSNRMLELRARQLGFLKQLATLDMNNRRLTI